MGDVEAPPLGVYYQRAGMWVVFLWPVQLHVSVDVWERDAGWEDPG